MKQVLSLITAFGLLFTIQAQNEKMVKAMKPMVVALDSIKTAQGWTAAANQFQRIADAEKTQWLPYYYAALSHVMSGFMSGSNQPATSDPLADKAEALLLKAEELQPGNDEIYIVKKMIVNLRLQADPMNRWQTYGPQGAEALSKAKAINPANPRVALLEGQDKFYTPEEFGGDKAEAKILFETSIKRFAEAKPASEIHPQWGLNQAQYFLSQVK